MNEKVERLVFIFPKLPGYKYFIQHRYVPTSKQTGSFIIITAESVVFGAMSFVLLSYKGRISPTIKDSYPPGGEYAAKSLNSSPICFCHQISEFEMVSILSLRKVQLSMILLSSCKIATSSVSSVNE